MWLDLSVSSCAGVTRASSFFANMMACRAGNEEEEGSIRQLDSDLTRDPPIVLNAAVALEVEDCLFVELRIVEIAIVDDQFVVLGLCGRDDLPVRIDDAASAEQRMAVLDAAFGGRDHPRGVLVGARLHREFMVEEPLLRPFPGLLRIDRRRVVTEHDHLDALQTHPPIGFGPTPVIADAHAHDAAHGAPHRKAEIAGLEIALPKMLERALGIERVMSGRCPLGYLPICLPS